MKFSKRKKAKMRRRRQATIARANKEPFHRCIERWEYDETIKKEKFKNIQEINAFFEKYEEPAYDVEDKITIDGDIYLLGKTMCYEEGFPESDKVVIFKALPHFRYVKLSPKRLLEKKSIFESSRSWERKSILEISDEGIVSYVGSFF